MDYKFSLQVWGLNRDDSYPITRGFIFEDKDIQFLGYITKSSDEELLDNLSQLITLKENAEDFEWNLEPLNFVSNRHQTKVASQVSKGTAVFSTVKLIQLLRNEIISRELFKNIEFTHTIISSALSTLFDSMDSNSVLFDCANRILVSEFLYPFVVFIKISRNDYRDGREYFARKISYPIRE